MHKRRTLISVWGIMTLSLLACSAATSVLFPTATPTKDHSSAILTIIGAERSGEVTITPSPLPTRQPTTYVGSPTPRTDLGVELSDRKIEASAPEEFVRAAGKPQVIELFAYW